MAQNIILTNPVEAEIMKEARKQGMLTILEDAVVKSSQKLVPFEEISTLRGGSDTVLL